jgi:hypothetical protein
MSVRLLAIAKDHGALSERFDHFEMRLMLRLTSVEAHAQADAILEALTELPARDRFALAVEISGDALTIGDLSKRSQVSEHITNFHEDGESIDFRIEIWKEVEQQRLSVYSPTALGAYLAATPLSDALAALSKRFHNRLVFECYSEAPGAGSATLRFVQAGGDVGDVIAPLPWRNRALALLQNNVYRADNTGSLLPQDFVVTQPIGVLALDAFMARAGAVLAAMFLSNLSDLHDNQLGYRITGYKLLAGTVNDLAQLVDDKATFQHIADWAYGAEGNSDKVGLARNVISLCVQRLEDVPTHPEIWDAIQSNYQIYLKENIATYLEVRNKLAELLAESTHKAHALVDGLLDSIRNGVLIVLTFLLTVVVINGLKDTGPKVIFSSEYLAIVWVLLGLSSLAIWASCRDARSRFDQGAAATRQLLKGMYAHVMLENEIDQHLEPTLTGNRGYLERQARKYLIFWLVLAAVIALSFLIGHHVFAKLSTPSTPTSREAPNASGQVRPAPTSTGAPQHAAEVQNAIGLELPPQPPQAGKTTLVPSAGPLPAPGVLSKSEASTDTSAASTKPKTGSKQ